jgi:hypothetical protein
VLLFVTKIRKKARFIGHSPFQNTTECSLVSRPCRQTSKLRSPYSQHIASGKTGPSFRCGPPALRSMQARSCRAATVGSPRRTLRSLRSLRAPAPPSVFRPCPEACRLELCLPPFFAPPLPSLRSSSSGAKNPGPRPTQEQPPQPLFPNSRGMNIPSRNAHPPAAVIVSHSNAATHNTKTVGNSAHYARPGPPNLHDERTPVSAWRRPISSLPLAAGLPPLIRHIGGVCSLRSFRCAPFPPVANPSLHGSKGEEQPPARGRGPSRNKKRKHPCLRFLLFRTASCRPRLHTATAGRALPARMFDFPSYKARCAPRLTQTGAASPKLRADKRAAINRPTAQADRRPPPGSDEGKPHPPMPETRAPGKAPPQYPPTLTGGRASSGKAQAHSPAEHPFGTHCGAPPPAAAACVLALTDDRYIHDF